MRLRYRELITVKNSLQHYIEKENVIENDHNRATNLLRRVTEEIEQIKKRHSTKTD